MNQPHAHDGNGRQAAWADLRRAIKVAVGQGVTWTDIIRLLAENAPRGPSDLSAKGANGHLPR